MANLPENLEIKQAIVDYCRAKGISSNELANQIQVSSATLSKIANDNWEGISEKLK